MMQKKYFSQTDEQIPFAIFDETNFNFQTYYIIYTNKISILFQTHELWLTNPILYLLDYDNIQPN